MQYRSFVAVFLLGFIVLASAQEDVIRIQIETDNEAPTPLSFFNKFSSMWADNDNQDNQYDMTQPIMGMNTQESTPFIHRPVNLFERLFNFNLDINSPPTPPAPLMDGPEVTVIRVIETDDNKPLEQVSSDSPFMPVFGISRVFERMHNIISKSIENSFQTMNSMDSDDNKNQFRGCPLMRACGDDIDRFCATERLSAISGSIGECLKSHMNELSEQCSSAVQKRMSHNEEEHSEGEEEQEEEEEEQSSEEKPEPEKTSNPNMPCLQDVHNLCSNIPEGNEGRISMIACLYRNQEKLSPRCLESVKHRSSFKCAIDAEQLCSGSNTRHSIMRCLISKYQQGTQLSTECSDALSTLMPKASTIPATPTQHMNIRELKTQVEAPISVKSDIKSSHGFNVPLIIGGVAVISVLAIAVVFVNRKFQRRRRTQTATVSVVPLSTINPTQVAVDITPYQHQEDL